MTSKDSGTLGLGHNPMGNPVLLTEKQRQVHAACFGATGSGKTFFMRSIIQHDLLMWSKTRVGLCVLDPHGLLADQLLQFCAVNRLNHVPIIPIDTRRAAEWTICFNPLRSRPGVEPATIISGCVDIFLLTFDQADHGNSTPRLERGLRGLLLSIFLSGGVIGDSLTVLQSPEVRRNIARQIEDETARSVLMSWNTLKEGEFQQLTESLANRLIRFVSANMIKLMVNQMGPSLDFDRVIECGGIVLVSLATAGGAIDLVDARTLGMLILQDIWLAARTRGKRESGAMKPFRVFVDEASRFLTPTMAEGMAEARGFGLQFFLAAQSTTQFRATPAGEQILNAILANVGTKITFRLQHPDDMDIVTSWLYRNEVGDRIKHRHWATKVLDHHVKYMESSSESRSRGTSDDINWSHTNNQSQTTGTSHTHTETEGTTSTTQWSRSIGESSSISMGADVGLSDSVSESEADGTTESRASSHTRQSSQSESESRALDADYDDLAKIISPKPVTDFDRVWTDEHEQYRSFDRALARDASESESTSDAESSGMAATHCESSARARQQSASVSESLSVAMSESETEGGSESESYSTSEADTTSESTSTGTSDARGGSRGKSRSETRGRSLSPMLLPVMGKEELPPQFRNTDEQLFMFSQLIASLPDRHAVVKIGTGPPQQIVTPTVKPARISPKGVQAFANLRLKRLEFAMPAVEAFRRLNERRKEFEEKYLGTGGIGEPVHFVRRIVKE